jgi:uncharacterized NAD-dependent epimerase/dehydratase family protein
MERISLLKPDARLAIFMEDALLGAAGKMGFGVLRYSPNPISCVVDSTMAGKDIVAITGIARHCPIVGTVEEAAALGADVLVLGIAPSGGLIPENWWPYLDRSLALGLSIVNGLHDLIGPRYPTLAGPEDPSGRQFIWDIRIEPLGLTNGKGLAAGLTCKRVLMIGSDMAVGKMTAGLELVQWARNAGTRTGFVATGQIGITVTGSGIPLDAIRVDFASGAVEREVLRHAESGAELVVIEGQGSLIHPSSTANLPLIRGSCPTHYILCHRAGQTYLKNLEGFKIPDLSCIARLYEEVGEACGMFERPKTAGVALNTAHLSGTDAREACDRVEQSLGIPCVDPIRDGCERLFAALV